MPYGLPHAFKCTRMEFTNQREKNWFPCVVENSNPKQLKSALWNYVNRHNSRLKFKLTATLMLETRRAHLSSGKGITACWSKAGQNIQVIQASVPSDILFVPISMYLCVYLIKQKAGKAKLTCKFKWFVCFSSEAAFHLER